MLTSEKWGAGGEFKAQPATASEFGYSALPALPPSASMPIARYETMPAKLPQVEPSVQHGEAVVALREQGGDAQRRVDWMEKMKAMPLWSGRLNIMGQVVSVKAGRFVMDGAEYLVSKDGRAVINRDFQLIGEIRSGSVEAPSPAFIEEMKQYGEAV